MYLSPVLLFLALAGQTFGVKITYPTAGINWTTTGPNIISWKVEPGDPLLVDIQLLHHKNPPSHSVPGLLPADGIIATGVDIALVEMVFTPSCLEANLSLPAGSGYSLRVLSHPVDGNRSILTSTCPFHVVSANATACVGRNVSATSDIQSSTSAPSSTSGASSTITQSEDISSSSSSNNHAGVIAGGIFGGLVLCDLLVCGVIMYNRRQRRVRRTRIQQLLVESGLGLGKTDSIEYRQ